MNEKEKLEEAKYFYSRMVMEEENREAFKYNLSAFLAAARSVMYYAYNEVEKTPNQKWYDDWMNSSDVLKFFKCKRDFNIHTAPIDPKKHVNIHITEVIHVTESSHIKVIDKNGRVKEEREIKEEPKPHEGPKSSVKSESRYEFDDWKGPEDLMTLCKMYIQELEKVVQDGISKGFITG
jgi:hypothetical protein